MSIHLLLYGAVGLGAHTKSANAAARRAIGLVGASRNAFGRLVPSLERLPLSAQTEDVLGGAARRLFRNPSFGRDFVNMFKNPHEPFGGDALSLENLRGFLSRRVTGSSGIGWRLDNVKLQPDILDEASPLLKSLQERATSLARRPVTLMPGPNGISYSSDGGPRRIPTFLEERRELPLNYGNHGGVSSGYIPRGQTRGHGQGPGQPPLTDGEWSSLLRDIPGWFAR